MFGKQQRHPSRWSQKHYPWNDKISRAELAAQIEDQIAVLSAHVLHWIGDHPRVRAQVHGRLASIDFRNRNCLGVLGQVQKSVGEFRKSGSFMLSRLNRQQHQILRSRIEIIQSELGNLRILLVHYHRKR